MGWGGGTHKFSMGNFKFVRSLDYTYELRKQASAFLKKKGYRLELKMGGAHPIECSCLSVPFGSVTVHMLIRVLTTFKNYTECAEN